MNLFSIFFVFCGILTFLFTNLVSGLEGEGIIGGRDALPGKYPYHVGISVLNQLICGGGIIDEKFVVTAAHCVTDEKGFLKLPFKIVAGVNSMNSKSSDRIESDVEKIFIPKDYMAEHNATHVNSDIAVLRLKQPLKLSSSKLLGKLQLPLRRSYVGETAVITGFGWNWVDVRYDKKTGEPEEKGGSYGKLRYAESEVMTNEACQKSFRKTILDTHICARVTQVKGHEGVCSGDSGGPLVYKGDTLIGVVSSSPLGCVEVVSPAIYTRVSSFLTFLRYAMMDLDSPNILTIKPIILPNHVLAKLLAKKRS